MNTKQLAIISGKGGTGKTSVTGLLAALAGRSVLADCDVDAPNLHLLLAPEPRLTQSFCGGKRAIINHDLCCGCGRCANACRFGCISMTGPANGAVGATYDIDDLACEGCGLCARLCPSHAIRMVDAINGRWFISETRLGPMVHARLNPGHENSGKLVSLVRSQAKRLAEQKQIELILIDGAPGVGCPVIASITGATHVLIVTEPTQSGLHDMGRALALAEHFHIPASICVNKWDIDREMTGQIEAAARQRHAAVAGRLRYDRAVVEAQSKGMSIVEHAVNGVAGELRMLWSRLAETLSLSHQDSYARQP